MFTNAFSGVPIGKVLSGISRVLGIANQVIPLYNQAKPMFNNSKKVIGAVKEIVSKTSPNPVSNIEEKNNKKTDIYSNLPVFFS